MWIRIILITLGCTFLLHEVNSKYVIKEDPYENVPIGETSHRDAKKRKNDEYYNNKYLHYTEEPYFDYFDYVDENEYVPKHVKKHSKHHKHTNYYEDPHVEYFPKVKESKKDKKLQEIAPEKKHYSADLYITDPHAAKYDKKEHYNDPYLEYDYYEPRYEKKHHSKDRYTEIRDDKYDPRYDYEDYYYYDDFLPDDKQTIHQHKHDHEVKLQAKEPSLDKIINTEPKQKHHHLVDKLIDSMEHHFGSFESTVANIENIQNIEPLHKEELQDQIVTLIEPPNLDDIIKEEIIIAHEHSPHHHHSSEHHEHHETIIPHVHHSHHIEHQHPQETVSPIIPQYIEKPSQNELYKNSLQNIYIHNFTEFPHLENIRLPINLPEINMKNISYFTQQSLLPFYKEPQSQNGTSSILPIVPLKKADPDDNSNRLFNMDEERLSKMFGPEPINEQSEWNSEMDERSRNPNFKHYTAARFCRRWWWIPRCKCFFRWMQYCWPRWTHPMCWCSTYCGWK